MSGTVNTPFASRIASACHVVGPFAPSHRIFACTLAAFFSVIWFSIAAGISTSHGWKSTSRALILVPPPGNSCSSFFWFVTQSITFGTSNPFSLYKPPPISASPTILYPDLAIKSAAIEPTFPNPWITVRQPSFFIPSFSTALSTQIITPRPVASFLPRDPPSSIGLPLTTAVVACPTCIAYVSITHAIVLSLVPTSGAGTSRSGPSQLANSAVYRRVKPSSSPRELLCWLQITPPFAPPNGISTTAHFQVIHAASALTSSRLTYGAKRIPPLPGPRTVECSTRYPVNTSSVPLSIPTGMYMVTSLSGYFR